MSECKKEQGRRSIDLDAGRLIDLEKIKRLNAMYFRDLDNKKWALFAQVFTEDACMGVVADPSRRGETAPTAPWPAYGF